MVKLKMLKAHSLKLIIAIIAASALSGCRSSDMALDDAYQPYGGSDMHPLSVAKGPVTMEVSTAQGTLQPQQIGTVSAFVRQATQAGVTPITVAQPSGGGRSSRVAREIASLMVQQGVPSSSIRFATYRASGAAPVRLTYVSSYGTSLKCGQWREDATETESNMLASNHGCAVQANIAAMVADPETLTVPAATAPIQAESVIPGLQTALNPSAGGGSSGGGSAPPATGGKP
jgi:pilus assembly protein CpaD